MPDRAKADVAILVALQEEYEVLAPVMSKDIEPVDGRYWFTFADVNGKTRTAVISVLGNMGNEESRVAADRLITAVQPSLVAIIGIAGMLSDWTRLGEVVVATDVDNYLEKGKLIDSGAGIALDWGGRSLDTSAHLTNLAKSLRTARKALFQNWKASVIGYMNDVIRADAQKELAAAGLLPPKELLHVGPIASGPVVGTSKNFKNLLRERNRQFMALEMESAGGLAAAHDRQPSPATLVIRGLSDPSDDRKILIDKVGGGGVRRWAMYNAATLLNLFLRQLPIWTDATPEKPDLFSERKEIHQTLSAAHLGDFRDRPSDEKLERIAAYMRLVTRPDSLRLDEGSFLGALAEHIVKSENAYPLRIEGEPGTGKTTLVSALYWHLYGMAERDPALPFPVYVHVQHFDDLAYDDDGKRIPDTQYADAVQAELDPLVRYGQSGNPVVMLIDGLDVDARFRSSVEKVLLETDISGVKKIVSVAPGLASADSVPPGLGNPERVVTLLPVRTDSDECDAVVSAFAAISNYSAKKVDAKLRGLDVDSVDLATLSMVQRTIDRPMFAKSQTLSDVYIAWCKDERRRSKAGGALFDTARMAYDYTFKNAAFDGSGKAAATDWKLIRSHANVRHCLIAWLIMQCLTDDSMPGKERLEILEHVYTFTINRFCKELLNKSGQIQNDALRSIKALFPGGSVTLRTSLAYLLGRFEDPSVCDTAKEFLRKCLQELTPKENQTRQDLMLVRTCFVSLTRLGDAGATSRYVSLILKNRDLDDLNRGFHLEYYGDVENYVASVNAGHRDHLGPYPKTAERLTQKIEQALENRSDDDSLEIEIFTLCSLAQHRQVNGTLDEDDRLSTLELIRDIESSDLVETAELNAYLQMVERNLSDDSFTPVTPLERLFELKVTPRTGWVSRQINLPVETVAAHSFGAFLIGLYFLPQSIKDEPAYSRDSVLLSVLVHDLAEAWTGDLLPSQKNVAAREAERKWFEYLGMLSTYTAVGHLAGVESSWREFEDRTNINGRLAKDLDRLDQLMQLLIYVRRGGVIADLESWRREINRAIKTEEGKRILRLITTHFKIPRGDDYVSGFVPPSPAPLPGGKEPAP